MRTWPWQSRTRGRGWLIALAVVVLLCVLGRLALPYVVRSVVNHKLENMEGGYQGTVDDVVVRALAAEIGLRDLRVVKKNGLVPVPFMQVKELVLGTVRDSWRLRNVLRVIEPNASFVDAESEARTQMGPKHQLENLSRSLPFQLLRVEVVDGQFHFRNFQTKPDIDVYAQDVNAVWQDLVYCLPPGSRACRSSLQATAQLMNKGTLKARGTYRRTPDSDFELDGSVRDLRVSQLNPVLAQYAKVDVKKGDADLDVRFAMRGKGMHVMLVPSLSGFEVVGADDKERVSFVRELGLALAAGYFERKAGKKAVTIDKKPGHAVSFQLIDRPGQSDQAAKN